MSQRLEAFIRHLVDINEEALKNAKMNLIIITDKGLTRGKITVEEIEVSKCTNLSFVSAI